LRSLQYIASRLLKISQSRIQAAQRELHQAQRLLRHPGRRLEDLSQRCDELGERLLRGARDLSRHQRSGINQLHSRLLSQTPAHTLAILSGSLRANSRRLKPAAELALANASTGLSHQASMLQAVSPLATVDRGYAIVERLADDGSAKILRSAKDTQAGDKIRARLAQGTVSATVEETDMAAFMPGLRNPKKD